MKYFVSSLHVTMKHSFNNVINDLNKHIGLSYDYLKSCQALEILELCRNDTHTDDYNSCITDGINCLVSKKDSLIKIKDKYDLDFKYYCIFMKYDKIEIKDEIKVFLDQIQAELIIEECD